MPSLFSTGLKMRLTAILIYGICVFALVVMVNQNPKIENESKIVSGSIHTQPSSLKSPLSIRLESTHDIQTWSISIDAKKLETAQTDMRQWINETNIPQIDSRLIIDTTPQSNTSPFAVKVSLRTPHSYHEKAYWSTGGDLVTSIDLAELHPSTQ